MSKTLDLLVASPAGSIEAYVQAVNRIPMLGLEEERELAQRFQRDQNLDAARRLVMSHLRFVVRIARGYNGYGLAQADLIQEGNIGLMKAVKRFDPNVGVRLVSFAVHWIRAEIHEFILRNWRIVKVATTKAQRKLFFNLRSSRKRLGWMNSQEVQDVARELGVEPRDVLEMEQRMSSHDTAFDAASDEDDENPALGAPAGYLPDTRFEPEAQAAAEEMKTQREHSLRGALAQLDERSRDIIARRWLAEPKMTLQELADIYQVSAERIRQLEKNALKQLKRALGDDELLLPATA